MPFNEILVEMNNVSGTPPSLCCLRGPRPSPTNPCPSSARGESTFAYGASKLDIMDRFWGLTPFDPPAVPDLARSCIRKLKLNVSSAADADALIRGAHTFGFVVHKDQGWWPIAPWIEPFKARDVRVVLLERTNVISHWIGSPGLKGNGQAPPGFFEPTRHQMTRLERLVRNREAFSAAHQQLIAAGVQSLLVDYEAFLCNPAQQFAQVFEFIGADPNARVLEGDRSAVLCNAKEIGISLGTKSHTKPPRAYLKSDADVKRVLAKCARHYPTCKPSMLNSIDNGCIASR
jgi:hypothetical protein